VNLSLLFVPLVVLSAGASTLGSQCKGNRELVDACFKVHGRAYFSNGTPSLRIWQAGTRDVLGVTRHALADDADAPIAPGSLINALDGFEHFVYGDFEVCPFTKKKRGEMQMVCMESATKLVVTPHGSR
jgi:hypothetical protein